LLLKKKQKDDEMKCALKFVDLDFLFALTDEKGKFDELVEDKGVKILIDPKALIHVIGTKMDFVDDKLR
jgi:iron-sulfur cluster assembly protein